MQRLGRSGPSELGAHRLASRLPRKERIAIVLVESQRTDEPDTSKRQGASAVSPRPHAAAPAYK